MSKSLKHQFIDWVRKQDADAEYDYGDVCGCAFYQFLRARGYQVQSVGGVTWKDTATKSPPIPDDVRSALPTFSAESSTFGALLARLEASEAAE